jgi:hypothetical protein
LFDEIFGKSLILFSEHLATHLLNSYDAVGRTPTFSAAAGQ